MDSIKALFVILADIVFPRRFVGCNSERQSVCIKCLSRAPLVSRNGTIDKDIVSMFDYRDPVMRRAIWLLKYNGHRTIAEDLGRMLYEYLLDDLSERQTLSHFTRPILIPIPSAKKRMRSRGFNQALLLARAIKRCDTENALTLVTDAIKKIRHTTPQAKIKNKAARLKNLHNAFAVTKPELIRGRNIILIDDVATTGATISEAKKVLKAAGARKVIGATVAH